MKLTNHDELTNPMAMQLKDLKQGTTNYEEAEGIELGFLTAIKKSSQAFDHMLKNIVHSDDRKLVDGLVYIPIVTVLEEWDKAKSYKRIR